MPRLLTQHSLACLPRQGAEGLAALLVRPEIPGARRILVNMQEGKMVAEFDAASGEDLEKFLASQRFHFDWILRLELEYDPGQKILRRALAASLPIPFTRTSPRSNTKTPRGGVGGTRRIELALMSQSG